MEAGFDIGSVVAKVKADLTNFKAGMAEAKKDGDNFGSNLKGMVDGIRGFAEQAAAVVAVQSVAFGELAKQAIDVASNFEQTQTSFGTLLGSEQKAADLMKEIMAFEVQTPFDIQTLTNAAKQMLAFGVAQEDVVPKMKMLTDMSQGQAARLQELVSIYGQVNSIQSLNGREVLRLSSIGIPIYDAIAEHFNKVGGAAGTSSVAVNAFGDTVTKVGKNNAATLDNANTKMKEQTEQLRILQEEHPKAGLATDKHNLAIMKLQDSIARTSQTIGSHTITLKAVGAQSKITGDQVRDMISNHEISADVFNKILTEMTSKGGLFFQENIRQMSTFSGIMSSATSQLQYGILNLMGIDIGAANEVRKGGLFDTLRNLAADLLDWLKKLQPMLKEMGENRTFQLAIEGLVVALASLAIILPAIAIALNPIILIVLAIEAVIIGLYIAWNTNLFGIRDITKQVIDQIQIFFTQYLMPAMEVLKKYWLEYWPYISNFLVGVWYAIKGVIEVVWGLVVGILEVGLALLSGDWQKAWKAMLNNLSLVWQGIQDVLAGALIMVSNAIGAIVRTIIDQFNNAWNKVQDIMNKIKDALDFTKRHSPSVLDIVQNGVSLVNDALGGINMMPDISKTQIANNILSPIQSGRGGVGGSGFAIAIDMSNAIISDSAGAARIGEKIGDSIIAKLKQNVRI